MSWEFRVKNLKQNKNRPPQKNLDKFEPLAYKKDITLDTVYKYS